ncbi:similar to Kazachstania africana KAFR_0C01140 hypothetical protein [Maudiozyma barnettii]|uniref:Uncharacterized protein n=1 Tax=Maudiozyma barnettii TaxID=61262 RepID=A0A8H2VKN5_9SACH|nr:uncharacterized protein KABA2_13S05588 [Kazachstania barnettii]CAB4257211.1 similar to Kazachstania africana KAFR_0C01140 hypothetical protein [Kazachstania barnettii]CAD1779581.1 similar to Kazachstania africana KAFR_0C01140 hypothetical protein [Kazachstania barnettii]
MDSSEERTSDNFVIFPGFFKNKKVFIPNEEITKNRTGLNYKATRNDIFLSKEQRQHKRKKIIELATQFYNANGIEPNNTDTDVSMSAVADFFNIPRQSFSDHIKGNHQNIAIHGYAKKGILTDENIKLLRDIVRAVRINENPDFDGQDLFASDKELINLISVVTVFVNNQVETTIQLGSQLELLAVDLSTDETTSRQTTLEKLLAFFNNPVLCVESFKLKSKDLDQMRLGLIALKKIYSSEHEVKLLNRRTISRSRDKLGIFPPNVKSKKSSLSTISLKYENSHKRRDTIMDPEIKNVTEKLGLLDNELPVTKDQIIRTVFVKLNKILDKKHQKSLEDIQEYRRLINDLITPLKAFTEYGTLIGEQFQKLTDLILQISFENAVLLRANGGGEPALGLPSSLVEKEIQSKGDEHNDSSHSTETMHF